MRPGLVALGDSITNGEGAPMLGVRAWSWAQWLATALELPYTGLAANAARAPDVLARQVPRLDGPYAIGCLWVGVNDVRSLDFDLDAYARDLQAIAESVAAACERVVMPTIPLDLGRPRAGAAKVAAANRAIEGQAARTGAVVVDLAGLRGWRLVLPDAVHLTAAGQVEVADRAYDALAGAAGVADDDRLATEIRHAIRPSALAERDPTVRGAARYAVTGHAAALARDWRRRLVEAVARRRAR